MVTSAAYELAVRFSMPCVDIWRCAVVYARTEAAASASAAGAAGSGAGAAELTAGVAGGVGDAVTPAVVLGVPAESAGEHPTSAGRKAKTTAAKRIAEASDMVAHDRRGAIAAVRTARQAGV
ncbi:hypothetical protein MAUB_00860 [Mycolicibacterium aubagnense]|uniref:Uncharacterized protein n=1 Tax=Mycolicibacterium aubagnense TaxID=319707 RepID=A0ABM7I6M4_9MYCO|nr:hypothetical protein MAUB_00860 [Mycolicibacterium aubagnense]